MLRIEHKTTYWLDKESYKFIRAQMREKKIRVNKFCADYQISRSYFYEMGTGVKDARKLLVALRYEDIAVPYDIATDERVEWR